MCTCVGYVYLTFDSEKSIKNLLVNCTCDLMDASQYYYKVQYQHSIIIKIGTEYILLKKEKFWTGTSLYSVGEVLEELINVSVLVIVHCFNHIASLHVLPRSRACVYSVW